MAKRTVIEFVVEKEFVTELVFPEPDKRKRPVKVFHVYPTLANYKGRSLPEDVNPRSHEGEALKSPVAKEIKRSLIDCPEDFYLINRGSTILAEQADYDGEKMIISIHDPENQGLADGATTDAVIGNYQKELMGDNGDHQTEIPQQLKNARLHLEIIIGMGDDRDRIANIVKARNTSKQVKSWSLADFKGEFEWIKQILENDAHFKGKIGFEENANTQDDILDVLRLMTLFHQEFDLDVDSANRRAPTIAYSGKGKMLDRLQNDLLHIGYVVLSDILIDILWLHDLVCSEFEKAYIVAFGSEESKPKLGRRFGVESRLNKEPYVLSLTGTLSNYEIPSGLIYPLLSGFRALIGYHRNDGMAFWKKNPFNFWEKYRAKLVARLIEKVNTLGGNPNVIGKRPDAYLAVHDLARLLLFQAKEEEVEKENRETGELVMA